MVLAVEKRVATQLLRPDQTPPAPPEPAGQAETINQAHADRYLGLLTENPSYLLTEADNIQLALEKAQTGEVTTNHDLEMLAAIIDQKELVIAAYDRLLALLIEAGFIFSSLTAYKLQDGVLWLELYEEWSETEFKQQTELLPPEVQVAVSWINAAATQADLTPTLPKPALQRQTLVYRYCSGASFGLPLQ